MSNVIKASSVRYSEAIKLFDTNERAEVLQREFLDNYAARMAAAAAMPDSSEDYSDEDGFGGDFTPGIFAEHIQTESEEEPGGFAEDAAVVEEQSRFLLEQTQAECDALREQAAKELEEAQSAAENIKNAAMDDAEVIRQQAQEDGYNAGYSEGMAAAQEKTEEMQAELIHRQEELERDYTEKTEQLIPYFGSLLVKYLEKLTGSIADEKKDLILYLIEGAVRGKRVDGEFIIRVSSEDYSEVVDSKERIQNILPENSSFQVVEDKLLEPHQCMIETDSVIFDCSLGEQLKGLITDLKILSQND